MLNCIIGLLVAAVAILSVLLYQAWRELYKFSDDIKWLYSVIMGEEEDND